jgi:hypothetical protein
VNVSYRLLFPVNCHICPSAGRAIQAEKSGRQALAALGTTRRKYRPATAGGHAGAKPVTPGALEEAWLKSTFHGNNPFRDWFRSTVIWRSADLAQH